MPREVTDDISMLERLVAPRGKDVLDIGCGGGALVRALAGQGARVVGIEISAEQLAPALARDAARSDTAVPAAAAAPARAAAPAAAAVPARYRIGRAEALPFDDGSVDVAVFMRTLHHVAPPDLVRALGEARRVLRPGGVVYVAEPLAEGDYFTLTSLVEDELEVRAAAQKALAESALAGLDRVTTVEYDVRLCVADLAALRARTVSVDPQRASVFDAREARIEEAFERLGHPGDRAGERCFLQPMRADVLRAASTQDS